MSEKPKYRFDNCFEQVFKWDQAKQDYIFIGSFFKFRIFPSMEQKEKIRNVENNRSHDTVSGFLK